ncbi:metallophosphoesterase [Streptomyces candidus]|uniref:Calcineurin-like phosphoesterase domain-containing protein n=1 Tax=Streptomyces candidus TaxID=67283 RepID=A0A7X0HJE7_9ACTN|nr:hypothetical protein [Streptomyces candidus]GHH38386.1 serine/threonine protein kinase [Streptomyces candidus]
MTQGAGQGPAVRTATVRDFRVPPYAQAPVATPYDTESAYDTEQAYGTKPPHGAEQAYGEGHAYGGRQAYVPNQAYGAPQAYGEQQPHDGQQAYGADAFGDAGEEPEGYTPTQRDLPVISRDDQGGPGDTLRIPQPDMSAAQEGEGLGPLFVVGDVHGYLVELLDALHEQGLIDDEGHWAAGNARLWFLGDFTDRGPDGIGVIDLVMRLSAEAAAAGGYCKALMGNHELLLLGARRFGDTAVSSGAGTATFQAAWLLNGGQKYDMERLQDVHLQWMARLDAVALEDGHLLTHSDTTAYLDYGSTITDVNDTVHDILTRNDADECWDVFRKFTKRFAFRDEGGANAVRELLAAYGGERIVHGHSPIPYLLGEVGGEDAGDGEGSSGPVVEGPHVYADGLAIAMDGGVTMAGKLLVVQLPLND